MALLSRRYALYLHVLIGFIFGPVFLFSPGKINPTLATGAVPHAYGVAIVVLAAIGLLESFEKQVRTGIYSAIGFYHLGLTVLGLLLGSKLMWGVHIWVVLLFGLGY
eukprot:TRINITY_DN13311_c0_g2_i1.p1 TRINITY_DN13311_c0_g2~~TRINITY_DN13311_c0_g2_i1.p1  ORF type:complete len:107 (-),score=15.96 TRINITY_DN13311_c0_g2_i1:133-453(-)